MKNSKKLKPVDPRFVSQRPDLNKLLARMECLVTEQKTDPKNLDEKTRAEWRIKANG